MDPQPERAERGGAAVGVVVGPVELELDAIANLPEHLGDDVIMAGCPHGDRVVLADDMQGPITEYWQALDDVVVDETELGG